MLDPPAALVLGFFDAAATQAYWWSMDRTTVARRLVKARSVASLPASVLGCPAWFAADGAAQLARAAR